MATNKRLLLSESLSKEISFWQMTFAQQHFNGSTRLIKGEISE